MTTSRVIGFLGLGNMGGPMAANLVTAGYAVRGFDPVEVARRTAAVNGIDVCPTPAAACQGAEVVVTMLPTGAHVLDLYAEGAGIVGVVKAGSLLIDCSTIDIADARAAHSVARTAGLRCVDAPVSGGVIGATAATLTFMVGGSDEDFSAAEPILAVMGKRIVHCGGEGTGQAAKVCNNMVLGISMIAVSESFVLAEALGLSDQAMFDVVSTASGQCWALTSNCPVPGPVASSPANRDYTPGFATSLMLKDLRLAVSAASLTGTDTALGRHAEAIYAQFAGTGAGLDFSAIITAIKQRSASSAQ
jgi:3-hydroxyisobutyrate dehydrogenase